MSKLSPLCFFCAVNRGTTPRAASVIYCAVKLFLVPSRTATAFYCAVHRRMSPRAVPAISLRRRELLSVFITPSRTATASSRAIKHCHQDLLRRLALLSLFIVMSRPVTAIYCAVHSQNDSKNCLRDLSCRQSLYCAVEKRYRFLLHRQSENDSTSCSPPFTASSNTAFGICCTPELRSLSSHQVLSPLFISPSRTSLSLSCDAENCHHYFYCAVTRETSPRAASVIYCAVKLFLVPLRGATALYCAVNRRPIPRAVR